MYDGGIGMGIRRRRCGAGRGDEEPPLLLQGELVDQDVGGAGSTGRGEENIRIAGGHTIVENMRHGMSPKEACLDALKKRGGRLAYPNGVEPAPRKRGGVKTTAYDATPGVSELRRLNRAVEAAKLKVPIAMSHPLARAAAAYRRVGKGHVLGKVVLKIR